MMTEGRYVGVLFIYNDAFVLQHRDDKPHIANPGMYGFFGGGIEPIDKTPEDAILREIREETDLNITESDIHFFREYHPPPAIENVKIHSVTMYYCYIPTDTFLVFEGKGSVTIGLEEVDAASGKITTTTFRAIKDFIEEKL